MAKCRWLDGYGVRDNAARVVFQHKPITVMKIEKCHNIYLFNFVEQAAERSQRAGREGKHAAGNLQHPQRFRGDEGFTAARW